MPSIDQFSQFDIRVGTVISASPHLSARKPSYRLEIDFGPLGVMKSSAQITSRYEAHVLPGRQVVAVVNLPPRRIAGYVSEVLVLGAVLPAGDVVLLAVSSPVANGARIG